MLFVDWVVGLAHKAVAVSMTKVFTVREEMEHTVFLQQKLPLAASMEACRLERRQVAGFR